MIPTSLSSLSLLSRDMNYDLAAFDLWGFIEIPCILLVFSIPRSPKTFHDSRLKVYLATIFQFGRHMPSHALPKMDTVSVRPLQASYDTIDPEDRRVFKDRPHVVLAEPRRRSRSHRSRTEHERHIIKFEESQYQHFGCPYFPKCPWPFCRSTNVNIMWI
ncbi:hypothetical protein F5Y16DRAFT_364127 [Xylariaceae sp. FL0255]|nr:hypothetical protein F5Y16DRAFT_364127 [Xylariaceae sp. FL0255]